jgi:acetyl-CoA acyltransferase
MANDRIVVVSGARTPFARARTVYAKMPPSALGAVAVRETVARADIDPTLIDELYFGIVSAPAEGSNISRETLFDSGLPATIPATTVNRYCASSAEAVAGIIGKIQANQIDIGLAGGVESISSIRALFSQEATDFFQDLAKAKTMGQRLGKIGEFRSCSRRTRRASRNRPPA